MVSYGSKMSRNVFDVRPECGSFLSFETTLRQTLAAYHSAYGSNIGPCYDTKPTGSRPAPNAGLPRGTKNRKDIKQFRDVCTETLYRDQECQTTPYSPAYKTDWIGSKPEILHLVNLTYNKGLPVGLEELYVIERARRDREILATLPPPTDISQRAYINSIILETQTNEFLAREAAIERLQMKKKQLLLERTKKKAKDEEYDLRMRLHDLWMAKTDKNSELAHKITAIQYQMSRKLRVMRRAREGTSHRKRDIINDYADLGSTVYAPLTRVSYFLDRRADKLRVCNKYLTTLEGFEELENWMPSNLFTPCVKFSSEKMSKSHMDKKRYEKTLSETYKHLQKNKNFVPLKASLSTNSLLVRKPKPVVRPKTPSIEIPEDEQEDLNRALILVQRVIRGRAEQNLISEGIARCSELLRELISTTALQDVKIEALACLTAKLAEKRAQHEHAQLKEEYIRELLSQPHTVHGIDSLRYIANDLIHLQQERRLHAFAMLVERERREREARESGKRQEEERKRREDDEKFKQSVKVIQTSVDTFLTELVTGALSKEAMDQASSEVKRLAARMDRMTKEVIHEALNNEESTNAAKAEEMVVDLVHRFLLPECRNINTRERLANKQRRFLHAAHSEILAFQNSPAARTLRHHREAKRRRILGMQDGDTGDNGGIRPSYFFDAVENKSFSSNYSLISLSDADLSNYEFEKEAVVGVIDDDEIPPELESVEKNFVWTAPSVSPNVSYEVINEIRDSPSREIQSSPEISVVPLVKQDSLSDFAFIGADFGQDELDEHVFIPSAFGFDDPLTTRGKGKTKKDVDDGLLDFLTFRRASSLENDEMKSAADGGVHLLKTITEEDILVVHSSGSNSQSSLQFSYEKQGDYFSHSPIRSEDMTREQCDLS